VHLTEFCSDQRDVGFDPDEPVFITCDFFRGLARFFFRRTGCQKSVLESINAISHRPLVWTATRLPPERAETSPSD
jgi:hypothetical protein